MNNTRRILIFLCAGLLAVTLAGCAGIRKQAFNKDANQEVKTIGLLEQTGTEKYFVQNQGHPGMGLGLIGGLIAIADMESKQNKLTELMKARDLKVVDEFQRALAADLQNAGYSVKMLKPQREKHACLKTYWGRGRRFKNNLPNGREGSNLPGCPGNRELARLRIM